VGVEINLTGWIESAVKTWHFIPILDQYGNKLAIVERKKERKKESAVSPCK
jgi:hypothetical protein